MSAIGAALEDLEIHGAHYGIRRYGWNNLPMKIRGEAAVYRHADGSLIYRRCPTDHGWPYIPTHEDLVELDWYVCNFMNRDAGI